MDKEGLVTIEGPRPPLEGGMEFRSTGGDVFGTWSDHSIITPATCLKVARYAVFDRR